MNGGLIVQIGTPEELVTRPADDYVANFTRDIAREKLLTVASVMEAPADGRPLSDRAVAGPTGWPTWRARSSTASFRCGWPTMKAGLSAW